MKFDFNDILKQQKKWSNFQQSLRHHIVINQKFPENNNLKEFFTFLHYQPIIQFRNKTFLENWLITSNCSINWFPQPWMKLFSEKKNSRPHEVHYFFCWVSHILINSDFAIKNERRSREANPDILGARIISFWPFITNNNHQKIL